MLHMTRRISALRIERLDYQASFGSDPSTTSRVNSRRSNRKGSFTSPTTRSNRPFPACSTPTRSWPSCPGSAPGAPERSTGRLFQRKRQRAAVICEPVRRSVLDDHWRWAKTLTPGFRSIADTVGEFVRTVRPEFGRVGADWEAASAVPDASDEFANSIHCYSRASTGSRIGWGVIPLAATRTSRFARLAA